VHLARQVHFLIYPVFEPLKGYDDLFIFPFGQFLKRVKSNDVKEQPTPLNGRKLGFCPDPRPRGCGCQMPDFNARPQGDFPLRDPSHDCIAGRQFHQEAAYLQRGYLMGLNAGLDKMFWYWNRDTKGEPNNFFDGCGVFSGKDEPKPAAVAYAAMAKMIKIITMILRIDMD